VSAQRSFGKAGTQKAFGPDGKTTAAPGQHRRASARTDRPRRAPVETLPAFRRQESGCRPDSPASAERPGFFSERNPRDAKRSPIFGRVMPSGTVDSEGLALLRSPDQRELDVSPRPFGGADTCQVPAPPALLGGTASPAALVPGHPPPLFGRAERRTGPGPNKPPLFGGAAEADSMGSGASEPTGAPAKALRSPAGAPTGPTALF
jgi:hypothetical protein